MRDDAWETVTRIAFIHVRNGQSLVLIMTQNS